MLAIPAVAQTVPGELDFGFSYNFAFSIPKEFSYNEEPCLMVYVGNDHNTIQIYDENLDEVKRITMKEELPYKYQLTYQDQVRDVVAVNEVQNGTICNYFSYDNFIRNEKNVDPSFDESCLITEDMGNGIKKIKIDHSRSRFTSNEQMYYAYSYFGMKYPKVYFIDNGKEFNGYKATYNVQYSDWKNAGTRVVDCSEKQERIRLFYVNLNKDNRKADGYFEVSQTLFNDDASYEYIMPKYKLSTKGSPISDSYISDEENEEKIITTNSVLVSEKKNLALSGFQILSENGNIVSDITFDSDFEGGVHTYFVYVVTIGNNTYLAFDGDYNGTSSTIFYKINKEKTNAIQKVKIAPSAMRISPTIANSGSTINVTFNDENEKGSDIVVVSASGAAMGSYHVPAGQTSAQIKTNSSTGMYCVSRLQKNKVTETKKIIVK